MLPEKILQSSLLDIIFDGRNKEYGAYVLRNDYDKRLTVSVFSTIGIVLLFVVLQSFHKTKTSTYTQQVQIIPDPMISNITPPEKQKPQSQPASQIKQIKTVNYQKVQIVKDPVIDKIPDMKDIDDAAIGTQTIDAPTGDDGVVTSNSSGGSDNNDQPAAAPVISIPEDKIFNSVEKMPQFPGGEEALKKFITRNMMDLVQLETGDKLVVLVSFVVNQDGSISDISAENGSATLMRDVRKAVAKMPNWIPGSQNNHPVKVLLKLPVTFVGE